MKQIHLFTKTFFVLLIFGGLFFIGCKKNSSDNTLQDEIANTKAVAEDDAIAELTTDDIFDNVAGVDQNDIGENIGLFEGVGVFGGRIATNGRTDSAGVRCFTITVTPQLPGVFPKTVTIDFGTGCTMHGHTRKGKIITVYTGPLFIPGKSATTTFDNYYIESVKVEGTHILTNTTGSNLRSFNKKAINIKLIKPNGNWICWNSDKTVTQVQGNGTPFYPLDDVLNITGNSNGEKSNGLTWSATITSPLVKNFTCRWISKGTVNITRNTNNAVLDYGNGACDNQATITINGVVHNITLH